MIEMFLIFCCAGIGEILSGDAASLRNPGESTPGSLISNLRTERANKKLKDWSDNLESVASQLDQSDGEGDSIMDHSSFEDEGKRSTSAPPEDPTRCNQNQMRQVQYLNLCASKKENF